MMEFLIGLTVLLLGAGAGYWLGYRQGCENTAADWSERMTRIEPTNRPGGVPTNLDGPPAKVTKSHMRQQGGWHR